MTILVELLAKLVIEQCENIIKRESTDSDVVAVNQISQRPTLVSHMVGKGPGPQLGQAQLAGAAHQATFYLCVNHNKKLWQDREETLHATYIYSVESHLVSYTSNDITTFEKELIADLCQMLYVSSLTWHKKWVIKKCEAFIKSMLPFTLCKPNHK